jgi:arylamine N-acetyltransferase
VDRDTDMVTTIDPDLQEAYLRRLGLDPEPPSIDALQRLHRRHVERVPYETMWIAAGDTWTVDPAGSVARIARHGRGGYCFHLNGALSELLRSLGYAVTRHVGGVHGPDGPSVDALTNHLVLAVNDLPTDDNPAGVWYVDAGLGDAMHEALPLVAGAYDQPPFHLVLDASDDGVGDWHLTHDPAGGFRGMSWRSARADISEFAQRNQWLSTAPDSGFVRVPTAQRRDATGVDVVRGITLTRVGDEARPPTTLTDRADWFGMLGDVFDLRFDGVTPERLDRMWARAMSAHLEYAGDS